MPKDTTLVCCTYVAHKPFDVPDGAWSATSTEKRAHGALWQQDMDDFHSERWLRDDGTFDAKALPRLGLKIESLRSKIVVAGHVLGQGHVLGECPGSLLLPTMR